MEFQRLYTQVLIIGSGIAGCTAALTLADAGHDVTLINAGSGLDGGNSELAQGGIIYQAAEGNDAKALERDILVAGHRYNHTRAVRHLCRKGPEAIEKILIERAGVVFDRRTDGSWHLTREGGHSAPRIMHRADYTGRAIMEGLMAQVKASSRIRVLTGRSAIDLLTSRHHAREAAYRYTVQNRCLGAYVFNEEHGHPETILADWTILATGGVGQVFLHSTNSPSCVGSGVSMAHRAGVALANLEFMQFHPTALYQKMSNRRPLITEALRGEGARLLDAEGTPFMPRYDKRGDLAPRDIVAQAM
ncbi:MAG: FAD-dependent oxidoreductase, partial [Desulfovibrionaceae bacterium]|nr:FAD-dependent oxidoreductase [Desulfovibrionaceae bacterium]